MTFFEELGKSSLFLWAILQNLFKRSPNTTSTFDQFLSISFRSLSTVITGGAFVGAILIVQFYVMLSEYEALPLLGGLNTSSIIKEVGPLIISFLLAGKIGAYTAAEIGAMRVTQQIDAIDCLGTNSMKYLIVPRFLGIIFSSMFLLLVGLSVSIVGAMLIADLFLDVNYLQYLSSIPKFTNLWTVISGFLKCLLYSSIVALVACQKGFQADGGAKGVGKAVTQCAVYTNLYIVLANYVSSQFLGLVDENAYHFFQRMSWG